MLGLAMSPATDLEEQLRGGVRKVLDWTSRHGVVAVPFAPLRLCGLDVDAFFNANTPTELEQLRSEVERALRALPIAAP